MLYATFTDIPCMRHQQHDNAMYHPYRLPSLLTVFNAILSSAVQGILKHKFGNVKADSMLAQITFILRIIP